MKHLLIILISILLLSSPVIGQSSKPLGVILPSTVMGNVSNSRKQILLNTLDEEVSQYFDVSPPTNVSSGDLPVVSDVFQLQIVEEDGDTQLSVRWTSENERKVETKLCGGCKTVELNSKLKQLVKNLIGERVVQKTELQKNINRGVLYVQTIENEKVVWGEKETIGKNHLGQYVGQIKDGLPNGLGIVYLSRAS